MIKSVFLALGMSLAAAQGASAQLTSGKVFTEAHSLAQVLFWTILVGAAAAAVIWAYGLAKLRAGDSNAVTTALGRLRIIRSAAIPFGAMTASFTLFQTFIGFSNAPGVVPIGAVAPGLAEASMAVMFGLFAAVVAVIGERHLEGKIRQAAA